MADSEAREKRVEILNSARQRQSVRQKCIQTKRESEEQSNAPNSTAKSESSKSGGKAGGKAEGKGKASSQGVSKTTTKASTAAKRGQTASKGRADGEDAPEESIGEGGGGKTVPSKRKKAQGQDSSTKESFLLRPYPSSSNISFQKAKGEQGPNNINLTSDPSLVPEKADVDNGEDASGKSTKKPHKVSKNGKKVMADGTTSMPGVVTADSPHTETVSNDQGPQSSRDQIPQRHTGKGDRISEGDGAPENGPTPHSATTRNGAEGHDMDVDDRPAGADPGERSGPNKTDARDGAQGRNMDVDNGGAVPAGVAPGGGPGRNEVAAPNNGEGGHAAPGADLQRAAPGNGNGRTTVTAEGEVDGIASNNVDRFRRFFSMLQPTTGIYKGGLFSETKSEKTSIPYFVFCPDRPPLSNDWPDYTGMAYGVPPALLPLVEPEKRSVFADYVLVLPEGSTTLQPLPENRDLPESFHHSMQMRAKHYLDCRGVIPGLAGQTFNDPLDAYSFVKYARYAKDTSRNVPPYVGTQVFFLLPEQRFPSVINAVGKGHMYGAWMPWFRFDPEEEQQSAMDCFAFVLGPDQVLRRPGRRFAVARPGSIRFEPYKDCNNDLMMRHIRDTCDYYLNTWKNTGVWKNLQTDAIPWDVVESGDFLKLIEPSDCPDIFKDENAVNFHTRLEANYTSGAFEHDNELDADGAAWHLKSLNAQLPGAASLHGAMPFALDDSEMPELQEPDYDDDYPVPVPVEIEGFDEDEVMEMINNQCNTSAPGKKSTNEVEVAEEDVEVTVEVVNSGEGDDKDNDYAADKANKKAAGGKVSQRMKEEVDTATSKYVKEMEDICRRHGKRIETGYDVAGFGGDKHTRSLGVNQKHHAVYAFVHGSTKPPSSDKEGVMKWRDAMDVDYRELYMDPKKAYVECKDCLDARMERIKTLESIYEKLLANPSTGVDAMTQYTRSLDKCRTLVKNVGRRNPEVDLVIWARYNGWIFYFFGLPTDAEVLQGQNLAVQDKSLHLLISKNDTKQWIEAKGLNVRAFLASTDSSIRSVQFDRNELPRANVFAASQFLTGNIPGTQRTMDAFSQPLARGLHQTPAELAAHINSSSSLPSSSLPSHSTPRVAMKPSTKPKHHRGPQLQPSSAQRVEPANSSTARATHMADVIRDPSANKVRSNSVIPHFNESHEYFPTTPSQLQRAYGRRDQYYDIVKNEKDATNKSLAIDHMAKAVTICAIGEASSVLKADLIKRAAWKRLPRKMIEYRVNCSNFPRQTPVFGPGFKFTNQISKELVLAYRGGLINFGRFPQGQQLLDDMPLISDIDGNCVLTIGQGRLRRNAADDHGDADSDGDGDDDDESESNRLASAPPGSESGGGNDVGGINADLAYSSDLGTMANLNSTQQDTGPSHPAPMPALEEMFRSNWLTSMLPQPSIDHTDSTLPHQSMAGSQMSQDSHPTAMSSRQDKQPRDLGKGKGKGKSKAATKSKSNANNHASIDSRSNHATLQTGGLGIPGLSPPIMSPGQKEDATATAQERALQMLLQNQQHQQQLIQQQQQQFIQQQQQQQQFIQQLLHFKQQSQVSQPLPSSQSQLFSPLVDSSSPFMTSEQLEAVLDDQLRPQSQQNPHLQQPSPATDPIHQTSMSMPRLSLQQSRAESPVHASQHEQELAPSQPHTYGGNSLTPIVEDDESSYSHPSSNQGDDQAPSFTDYYNSHYAGSGNGIGGGQRLAQWPSNLNSVIKPLHYNNHST